jgi:WD40 repeat protein
MLLSRIEFRLAALLTLVAFTAEAGSPRADLYGDPLPPGALARLGTVRLRHDDNYGSLAVGSSPTGKTIIATGGETSLRFWDAATGKLLRQVPGRYQYTSLRFSPDGKVLATHDGGTLGLVDVATGRPRKQIADARGHLLAFSPDSKLLATGTDKGIITLRDTGTGEQVARREGVHRQAVISGAFTRDGQILVTLSRDRKLCRWEVATGTLRKTLTLSFPQWRTLRLSPDARTLAVTPYRADPVQLWDTESGSQRCQLQGELTSARYGLAFSPDSRTLATDWTESGKDEATISLWDVRTGRSQRRFRIPSQATGNLHFTPDGRRLMSNGGGPLIYLWDSTTGRRRLQRPAHEGVITSLSFTPDSKALASGSQDGTIRLWETATGKHRCCLPGQRWGGNAVTILPDGQLALASGPDSTLRLWDLSSGREIRRFVIEQPPKTPVPAKRGPLPGYQILTLGLASDGRTAASFSYCSRERKDKPQALLHIWDLTRGRAQLRRPAQTPSLNNEVLLFSPDARTYISHLVGSLGSGVETTEPSVSPGGTDRVGLRDVATGRLLLTLPEDSLHIGFSPDGRTLVTLSSRLRFWELASGKERFTITVPEHGVDNHFTQLAFARDGRTLATARGTTIQVWDAATGQELLRRTGYEAEVSCLAFTPDGKVLASGHRDSTILLWALSPEIEKKDRATARADRRELEAWWADLASASARRAHTAIWKLRGTEQAVPLLRKRISPVERVPAERLQQLLADLDSNQFARREAAAKALAELEELALPVLEQALQANPSPEKRRRIEKLLAVPRVVRSPEKLRGLRAVEVLEYIGTPEARAVLEHLARGAVEARLTREAQASLTRMVKPSP